MRPIRFNTCNFCCIYLLNNRNFECRHTSIKRCYTQGLHISFQYSVAKVLIWKLSMLLVLLFAGCLFLEVPFFSSQFERKIQNLEWGPLDLTLATCNSCCIHLLNKKKFACRFTWIKRCDTQGLHISFPYFVEKVLVCKLFMLLVLLFAGCLFLEVPTFSSQFERKIQNLEWGPLDLTLATLAVFTY